MTDSFSFGLQVLAAYPEKNAAFDDTFFAYIDTQTKEGQDSPLILLSALDREWEDSETHPDNLRASEKEFVTVVSKVNDEATYFAFYDLRK